MVAEEATDEGGEPRSRSGTSRWSDLRLLAVPILLFGLSILLGEVFDFDMRIVWKRFQVLDQVALESNPLGALLLLHSQPPVMNALLALFLKTASLVGCEPEAVASLFYQAVTLATLIGLHRLVLRLTGSSVVAALAGLALVADPAFLLYAYDCWYPHLLLAEMTLLAYNAERLFATGQRRFLWQTFASVALVCLTRSLFHPLWAVVTMAIVASLYWRRYRVASGGARGIALPVVISLLVIGAWPAKNLIVFGQASFSSWTGINLTDTLQIKRPAWAAYLRRGKVPEETAQRALAFQERYGEELAKVVTAASKSDGSRNWNNLITLDISPGLKRQALTWRLEHPGEWATLAAVLYTMWARPSHINAYTGEPWGLANARYQAYAGLYERLFFTEVRGLVESVTPTSRVHKMAVLPAAGGAKVRYSLFGALWFPLVMVLALFELRRSSPFHTVRGALILLCLFQVAWTVVVPCLTMGVEGNRMRYSTSVPFLLLLIMVVQGLLHSGLLTRWPRVRAGE